MNAKLYPVTTDTETTEAVEAAREALNAHETIVIPTDTVYGIACDAFSHQGVSKLLADKGRSRTMPPPVLIFDLAALAGVADEIPNDVYDYSVFLSVADVGFGRNSRDGCCTCARR